MKKTQYRIWLKKRNLKLLKKRTQKKMRKKTKNRGYSLNKKKNNRNREKEVSYNRKRFIAPDVLSFIENPVGTTKFFNDILEYIKISKKNIKEIFIDISLIKQLTIDALMYLIAIINNMNNAYKIKNRVLGNFPQNKDVLNLLKESGFLKYVKTNTPININKTEEKVQIKNGKNSDTETAKKIKEFLIYKSEISKSQYGEFYDLCIELMSNTYHHAYNNNSVLEKVWYVFVEEENNKLKVSFLDVGDGIIQTIKKNFTEKIDIINKKNDSDYIFSALKGEFRSRTNKKYRNRGLPTVYQYGKNIEIEQLKIITGRGIYTCDNNNIDQLEDMEYALQGTVYYWEINLDKLKERLNNDKN